MAARSERNHAHDVVRDFVPEGEEPDAPVEREDFRDFVPSVEGGGAVEPSEEPLAQSGVLKLPGEAEPQEKQTKPVRKAPAKKAAAKKDEK